MRLDLDEYGQVKGVHQVERGEVDPCRHAVLLNGVLRKKPVQFCRFETIVSIQNRGLRGRPAGTGAIAKILDLLHFPANRPRSWFSGDRVDPWLENPWREACDMTVGDRVKLDLTFDVAKMQREVLALPLRDFIEYSVLPLTAPTARPPAKDDPVLDYADGSWATWNDTPLLQACPYLSGIVKHFRSHTTVTLVRLLRLAPGGIIKEHRDPTLGLEVERSVIRLTVPVISNDAVTFWLNETPVSMQPGECWYLRFSDPHRARNQGGQERIHLSIDMIPNAWVRSLIQRG
jgi:hypothetical protein